MSSRIVSNLALPGNIPTLLAISLTFWFVFYWSRNCLPFRSTWVHPWFVVGFVLLNL